jgi:integrase
MATIRKRTGRHGDVTYTAMVRRVGFPTLTETFPTRRDAETWATTQEADITAGKVSKDAQGRKRTLAEAIIRYRKEVLPLKRDGSMYGFTLDWWETNHGTKRLGEVTRSWLVEARAQLMTGTFTRATPGSKRSLYKGPDLTHGFDAKPPVPAGQLIKGSYCDHAQEYAQPQAFQRTPATCNRYMAALSSVFSQVCGDWEWLQPTANPFAGLSKLPEGRNKGTAYTDDARARLLQETAKDPQLHTLVQVALATAARAGELVGLTWACVELGETEGRLMFTDTKNGSARIAWVFGDALVALRMLQSPRGNGVMSPNDLAHPVFPGQWSHKHQRYGKYDYLPRLHAALERAGLKMKRPFHALRHTAATNMARMGANGHQLKALGGWKSNAVDTYIHIAGQDTKDLARAHANRLTQEGK